MLQVSTAIPAKAAVAQRAGASPPLPTASRPVDVARAEDSPGIIRAASPPPHAGDRARTAPPVNQRPRCNEAVAAVHRMIAAERSVARRPLQLQEVMMTSVWMGGWC
jgi:hypothetical protein